MLNNESMEMYLETILRLCKSNEKVRAVDIANQMRISKVSVCHAIKNLLVMQSRICKQRTM